MIRLTPKNMQFFDLLEESGQKLGQVAAAIAAASQGTATAPDTANTVIGYRDACDILFDQFVEHLHAAFVTPIDRDDLYNLGFDLDRVVEAMERLANRWVTYDLSPTDPHQVAILEHVVKGCHEVRLALPLFRRRSEMTGIAQHFREIRNLDRAAEEAHRRALKSLCQEADAGPKWVVRKEILDLTMTAMRLTRNLADTFHKVVIRNV